MAKKDSKEEGNNKKVENEKSNISNTESQNKEKEIKLK